MTSAVKPSQLSSAFFSAGSCTLFCVFSDVQFGVLCCAFFLFSSNRIFSLLTAMVTFSPFCGKYPLSDVAAASRYGIDTNVSVGEKVRCCFLPTDAVLVDREERSEEVLPDQSGPCAGGTHA